MNLSELHAKMFVSIMGERSYLREILKEIWDPNTGQETLLDSTHVSQNTNDQG